MFKLSYENFFSEYIENFFYFSQKCSRASIDTRASTGTLILLINSNKYFFIIWLTMSL